jgi:hypothetical protein
MYARALLHVAGICIGSQLSLGCVSMGGEFAAADVDAANSDQPAADAGTMSDAAVAPPAVDAGSLTVEPTTDTATAMPGFLEEEKDGWLRLIAASWQLPKGHEAHFCVRVTAPRDVYLHEFAAISPVGTHHTVLTAVPGGSAPDGVTACAGGDISGHQVYGSGVGTESSALPDGIAMQVRAGEQLVLNLHLFNTHDTALSGISGVMVRPMAADQVKQIGEGVLAGPVAFNIPSGLVTKNGKCTFSHDATLFSVQPHMHQLGVHMKVVAKRAAADSVTLFDDDYNFDSQQRFGVPMVAMKKGDTVQIECTYQNDTKHSVSWGQSSLDEMCFAGLGRFPAAADSSYLCAN